VLVMDRRDEQKKKVAYFASKNGPQFNFAPPTTVAHGRSRARGQERQARVRVLPHSSLPSVRKRGDGRALTVQVKVADLAAEVSRVDEM
jgi:hypothetical protein